MSAGMPRTIPAPLRAKGTSPLGTPDCRRRTVNDGAITRLQLAIAPPCHGPPALVPTPFDGSKGSPSLRSAHLPRCTPAEWTSATRDMQDMYSVQRNILPGRSWDVRTAPKSLPQNRATALPAVARTPDTEVSPGLFRHLCSRGQAPRRPAWRGRSPLP